MTARTRIGRLVVAVAVALTTAALAAVSLAATASAATDRSQVGSIAKLPEHTQVLGALSATRRLALTVSLEPRDPAALARYATAVSTPGNPNYGRFLTVSHFAARFGAPRSHIVAVRRTLRDDGLTIGHLDRNDLTLGVSGSASTLEHAFRVSLFAVRVDARSAFANSSAATLPSSIARDVEAVNGFDDVTLEHSVGLRQQARARAGLRRSVASVPQVSTNGGPQPCAAAAETAADLQGLTADSIATAYGFPALYGAGDLGQGQTIGLIEIEPFNQSDIATYDACYGIAGTVTPFPVAGGSTPSTNDGESALDIEVVQGMAPKAAIDVYEGPGQVSSGPGIWSAAISADAAKVISASLGSCEPHVGASVSSAENTLFQEAAAQGQTLLASSGDQGSAACDEGSAPSTALAVNDPSSQPFITAVGGTTLYGGTNAGGVPVVYQPGDTPTQGVWNDGVTGNGASGSTGGISTLWPMPSYQSSAPASLGVTNSHSSATPCSGGAVDCREVPDVSANADPDSGYVVFENGGSGSEWTTVGGTSAASPLWASWIAETNDLAACRGLTVGFANPSLYAIAGSSYSANFTDITNPSPITGAADNDAAGANGGLYPVTAGYDMATGLGSMTSTLANSLCALRAPVFTVAVATPGAQTTRVGTPVSLQVHGTDSGGAALSYTATGLPAGLAMSAAGLITGTPTTAGTSTVTVAARDSVGNTGSVQFAWSVAAAKSAAPKLRATGVKLSGLGKRRPTLSFTLKPPSGSVKSLTVTVPKGLSFAKSARTLARRIKLKGGRKFVAKVKHGALTLTLNKPAATVSATIGDGALVVSKSEASKIKHHKVRSLTIRFGVTNTKHQTSNVAIKIGKLS
jgi:subtilase family serine protease